MGKARTAKPAGELQHSDPTPQRLLMAGGLHEVPTDKGVSQIITFKDDALNRARRSGLIDQRELEAGEGHYENWYGGGLSPRIPCTSGEAPILSGDYHWDYLPKNDAEEYHRREYRRAVQAMGLICSRIVELVVCHNLRIEHVELGWPNAEKSFKKGLQILAGA